MRPDEAYLAWGVLLGSVAGGIIGHFRTSYFGRRIFLLLGALVGFLAGGLVYALVSNTCR